MLVNPRILHLLHITASCSGACDSFVCDAGVDTCSHSCVLTDDSKKINPSSRQCLGRSFCGNAEGRLEANCECCGDEQCADGLYCSGQNLDGACLPKEGNCFECTRDAQCQSGKCYDPGFIVNSQCAEAATWRLAENCVCEKHDDCSPGYHCNPGAGFKCTEDYDIGETCDLTGVATRCKSGLGCSATFDVDVSRCVELLEEGEGCDLTTVASKCKDDLFCSGLPSTCKEKLNDGEGCLTNNACKSGLCSFLEKKCGQYMPEGASCNRLTTFCDPDAGLFCSKDFVCAKKRANGQSCLLSEACQSGSCVFTTCVTEGIKVGGSCGPAYICEEGLFCNISLKCQVKLDNGQACGTGAACKSGNYLIVCF